MSRAAVACAAILLSACAVGPDFQRPEAPATSGYTSSEVALPGAGDVDPAQELVPGAEVQAAWWQALHSAALDDVVRLALAGNPSLQAARANLAQAREQVAVARGGLYPQLDADVGASRVRAGGNLGAASGTLLNGGLAVSYNANAFGGVSRLVEQQSALAELQRYQLAATYLALTGEAVTQAIAIAAARDQIAAVQDIVALDEHNLQLVRIAHDSGKVPLTDVLNAQSQLASDRALLPPIRQQLSVAQHALAVLAGRPPAAWQPPDFDLASLSLPVELPLRVPAALARERPDILAAEAQLHAATAAIGVATANLYPDVTLSASWTQQAGTLGALFDPANGLRTLAAQLVAPIFHGGALQAERRAAEDAMQAQLALYQQTLLTAFGQIADTLRALEHDAEALAAQRAALEAAESSLSLDQESYAAGQASLLELLQAQRLYQQARLGYARAKSQRYQDTVQLFLAMGGGWEHAESVGEAQSKIGIP